MLDPRDLRQVAATFRVAEDQVRRDHLIGHALAAIAGTDIAGVTFIGGTALSWTHLPDGRLSEDIDLMTKDRRAAAELVEREIPRRLRREYPGCLVESRPPRGNRDRGHASRAVGLVLRLMAEQLGLHRAEAHTRVENLPSHGVLRKNGFRSYGIAHEHIFLQGEWHDEIFWERRLQP